MNKETRTRIIFAVITAIIAITASVGISYFLTQQQIATVNTRIDDVQSEMANVETQAVVTNESTGESATYITGGTASITTEDGVTLDLKIPDTLFNISDLYLDIIGNGYGNPSVTADNIVVAGNQASVVESTTTITCVPYSQVYNIYEQLYGEAFAEYTVEDCWGTAYYLWKKGELPETTQLNFKSEEIGTLEKDGVTFTLFNVEYDTEYTPTVDALGEEIPAEEQVTESFHTQMLAAYSDGTDAIEIEVFDQSEDIEIEKELLKEFLQITD